MRWTIGRKLGAAFGGVSLLFLLALVASLGFSAQADRRWNDTLALGKAEAGANQQVQGIRARCAPRRSSPRRSTSATSRPSKPA